MGIGNIWENIVATNITVILILIYLITILSTAIMVVHEKRDPHKTSTWVLILILLPIIGLIFYIFFGQSHRKEKLFSRKAIKDLQQIEAMSRNQLVKLKDKNIVRNPNISSNQSIITLLLNNSKALLTEFNRVKILPTGELAFNSLIESLEQATCSIHMQFYIVSDDEIGNRIKSILISKAREGVEVRLIFDDVGSWSLPKRYIRELTGAGVEVFPFMEVKFPLFTSKMNYRNHRKIIVVDGKVGYMGGMNIADRYIKGDKRLGPWYDIMLRIEGESVSMLQMIFVVDWFFVSGKVISDRKRFFPKHNIEEVHPMQITSSGPDSDWASIMQAIFAAITRAKEYIYIASPYFVPNESILTALKTASLGGIDVRIVLPGRSDSTMVYWSSLSYVTELIEAGIRVYLFKRGFIHSKILMIDGNFSSVGSANMDIRSFEDNFEVMAMIYDRELTAELEKQFLDYQSKSKLVNPKQWGRRRLRQTFMESVARLFSPLF